MEFEVSVPRSDLLGVSGLRRELSPRLACPPPNIMLGRLAGVDHLVASALRAPPPPPTWNYNLSVKSLLTSKGGAG